MDAGKGFAYFLQGGSKEQPGKWNHSFTFGNGGNNSENTSRRLLFASFGVRAPCNSLEVMILKEDILMDEWIDIGGEG